MLAPFSLYSQLDYHLCFLVTFPGNHVFRFVYNKRNTISAGISIHSLNCMASGIVADRKI